MISTTFQKMKFPADSFFEEIKIDIEKKIIKRDAIWSNKTLEYEKQNRLAEEIENVCKNKVSMHSLVLILDAFSPRTGKQLYDATKIYLSNQDHKKCQELDKFIISKLYNNLNEDELMHELCMLHFFSGFSLADNKEQGYIYLQNGYLGD